MTEHEVLAKIVERVREGLSFREIAETLGVTTFAARLAWIAEVDGGQRVTLCGECRASGSKDGAPCKTCLGRGVTSW